jgi:hypothetical protein
METHFPLGISDVQAVAATGTIEVNNAYTRVVISPSAAVTLSLTINEGLPVGARLFIRVENDATGRNITLDTSGGFNEDAPVLTGVADDVDSIECVYNGTDFEPVNGWFKIHDDA